jgi:DNA uptake protein ComE-like DNA-binding protein
MRGEVKYLAFVFIQFLYAIQMPIKNYFTFSRGERLGLLALTTVIIAVQFLIAFADFTPATADVAESRTWLAMKPVYDSLNKPRDTSVKLYPFNPNFITDFKGYKLGMRVGEIDRLHAFRKTGKYVNTAGEFQKVTGVSDSLLAVIAPYFKFPDWVKTKRRQFNDAAKPGSGKRPREKIDINRATKEDLVAVYGIGDALSDRILKMRETLGGFVAMDQMSDVWGLSPEVVERLLERFDIKAAPNVKKIAINDASVKELAQFPYFRYALAREIVTARSMKGPIRNAEDLQSIKNFPGEKVSTIAVYLEF